MLEERIAPRGGLPPLLTNLGDRPPEALQYLGTSFGLTQTLFNFWRKGGYAPVYLRQNASDITGAAQHHTLHERLLVMRTWRSPLLVPHGPGFWCRCCQMSEVNHTFQSHLPKSCSTSGIEELLLLS